MIGIAAGVLTDKLSISGGILHYHYIYKYPLAKFRRMVYHIFMTVSRRSIVKTARGNSIYERTE